MINLCLYNTFTSSISYKDKISPLLHIRKFFNCLFDFIINNNKNQIFLYKIFLSMIKLILFSLSDLENM